MVGTWVLGYWLGLGAGLKLFWKGKVVLVGVEKEDLIRIWTRRRMDPQLEGLVSRIYTRCSVACILSL